MNYLSYGPVVVTKGYYKNRIGYYDGEEYSKEDDEDHAIVLFGDFFLASKLAVIPFEYLAPVNSQSLMSRHDELLRIIYLKEENGKKLSQSKRMTYLEEIHMIYSLLSERMYEAMFIHKKDSIKVFLSHSSSDKEFVKSLAVDLKYYGFDVWLDEWNIFAGESISSKIADGISKSRFVILILSKESVDSRWVESEWESKYWDEIQLNEIMVIPIIKEKCEIPQLLKSKKYIDFTIDYSQALEDLKESLVGLSKANKSSNMDAEGASS